MIFFFWEALALGSAARFNAALAVPFFFPVPFNIQWSNHRCRTFNPRKVTTAICLMNWKRIRQAWGFDGPDEWVSR